jgi:hypothetical protein
MPTIMPNRPIWIARGVLAANAIAGSGEQAPPGSGATITIFDSTAGGNTTPMPFTRLVLHIDSSADSGASGVIIEGSTNNGITWTTMQAAQTYLTASGPTDYDVLVTMPQVRFKYTNSAAVLTRWNMSLEGLLGDRSKGT